jgi:glutaredoxin
MQNYTIYTRDGCPYCVKIKEVMKLAELNHVVYNLGQDFDRDGFYSQFGQGATFPQVVLNGDNLGGCTDTVKYLKEKNIV